LLLFDDVKIQPDRAKNYDICQVLKKILLFLKVFFKASSS
jgi:hypothetical protein